MKRTAERQAEKLLRLKGIAGSFSVLASCSSLVLGLAVVLAGFACGFGGTTLLATDSPAHAASKYGQPLKFDSPPVDTGRPAAASSADSSDLMDNEGRDASLAEPGRDLVEQLLNEATAEESPKPRAGAKASAGKEDADKDGGPVRLFNTADLFRKPIKGNAPQWERVLGEVKKKV